MQLRSESSQEAGEWREVSLVTGVKNDPTRPQEDRQSGGAMVPDVKEREVSWSRWEPRRVSCDSLTRIKEIVPFLVWVRLGYLPDWPQSSRSTST